MDIQDITDFSEKFFIYFQKLQDDIPFSVEM